MAPILLGIPSTFLGRTSRLSSMPWPVDIRRVNSINVFEYHTVRTTLPETRAAISPLGA